MVLQRLRSLRRMFFIAILGSCITLIAQQLYHNHVNYWPGDRWKVSILSVRSTTIIPLRRFSYAVRKSNDVNCLALFNKDTYEIQRSKNISKEGGHTTFSREQYINMTTNCNKFISERGYITESLTQDEKEFPLAFSILMHKDPGQVERLLRAIYRPEHTYCIHLDKKSGLLGYQAMSGIASCFDNVFMSSTRISVHWGWFDLLKADLICINDLWNSTRKWKYMLTLTGQEFPLRTNYELVQILKTLKGGNIVMGQLQSLHYKRWERAGAPPHNITPAKGSFHVVLSRGAVDFMLHDQRSLDLLNWTSFTAFPDETYYVTLNYNDHLGVPGTHGNLSVARRHRVNKPCLARYKHRKHAVCSGIIRHGLCIFGNGDLHKLASRKELFANKLYWNYQHTLDCMEELISNRTRDQYLGNSSFDLQWYQAYARSKYNVT